MQYIIDLLLAEQDKAYADFQQKLIPDIPRERFIGVRTPVLRRLAKQLAKEPVASDFLAELPHRYFDENQLHAFLVAETKDFRLCMQQTEAFLPYIDNWATCDQFSPRVFGRHKAELLPSIMRWLGDERPYVVRFGIGMLMQHFLKEEFREEYPVMVASVASEHYYVRMMQAWYFATALVWQWDTALSCLSELDDWTRRKAIQKARESYRLTEEQKSLLKAWQPSRGLK